MGKVLGILQGVSTLLDQITLNRTLLSQLTSLQRKRKKIQKCKHLVSKTSEFSWGSVSFLYFFNNVYF